MAKNIFTKLESRGFIRRGKVKADVILNYSYPILLDFLDELAADTFIPNSNIKRSIYSHCSSFNLGGGREECWNVDCRIKAVNELARFSALYSDQVIIHNFLADFAPSWGHAPETDNEVLRFGVIDDLEVLLTIRPLLESGQIVLFSPPAKFCPYCHAERLFGSEARQDLALAIRDVERLISKQLLAECWIDDDGLNLATHTGKDFFAHESQFQIVEGLPAEIFEDHVLMESMKRGETVNLPKRTIKKLHLAKLLVNSALPGLRYQMSVADVLGTSYLTDKKIDLKILSYLSPRDDHRRRNAIIEKYISCLVPFADDVPNDKLIKLRDRESGAFLQFRLALNRAIDEVLSQDSNFCERDAKEIYSDIIMPELSKLDQKVSEAKRDLVTSPVASIVGTAGLLSFGLYLGLIPGELKEVATTLGLVNVAYNTIKQTMESIDIEKQVRQENLYFLWKAKQIASRRRK